MKRSAIKSCIPASAGLALALLAAAPALAAWDDDPEATIGHFMMDPEPIRAGDIKWGGVFTGAVLEGDLEGAPLCRLYQLDHADLSRANCTKADFTSLDLSTTTLHGGQFKGAVFRLATVKASDAQYLGKQEGVDLSETLIVADGQAPVVPMEDETPPEALPDLILPPFSPGPSRSPASQAFSPGYAVPASPAFHPGNVMSPGLNPVHPMSAASSLSPAPELASGRGESEVRPSPTVARSRKRKLAFEDEATAKWPRAEADRAMPAGSQAPASAGQQPPQAIPNLESCAAGAQIAWQICDQAQQFLSLLANGEQAAAARAADDMFRNGELLERLFSPLTAGLDPHPRLTPAAAAGRLPGYARDPRYLLHPSFGPLLRAAYH